MSQRGSCAWPLPPFGRPPAVAQSVYPLISASLSLISFLVSDGRCFSWTSRARRQKPQGKVRPDEQGFGAAATLTGLVRVLLTRPGPFLTRRPKHAPLRIVPLNQLDRYADPSFKWFGGPSLYQGSDALGEIPIVNVTFTV